MSALRPAGRVRVPRAAGLLLGLVLACGRSGPDVLLVVLDTARADAVSTSGAPQPATPTLAALAAQGVTFTNARSTSAWTLPAHGSLFTGRYVSRHGAHHESHLLAEEQTTLAELLAPTHDTAGFSENPHIGLRKGFAQGFAHFEETWRRTPGRADRPDTIVQVRRWLREREGGRPFFLFVNLMDPHLPYAPPRELERRFLPPDAIPAQVNRLRRVNEHQARRAIIGSLVFPPEELALLRGLYRADVAFADARLAGLVEELERLGRLARTLVVVVSDHGENIGDHGLMEHQFCLYESLLRVPMILRLPGVFEGGAQRDDPVQLVDVAPTVLAALGVPRERWPAMDGRSLFEPVSSERALFAETMRPLEQRILFEHTDSTFDFSRFDRRLRSVQLGALKLIESSRGAPELYDLAADPDETTDLAAARPADVERLQEVLQAQLGDWVVQPGEPPELDLETRDALRALGYGS